MRKIKVVAYKENSFFFTSDFDSNALKKENLIVGIDAVFMYQKDTDHVGTQLTIEYKLSEKTVLSFRMILTILAGDWTEFMAKSPTEEEQKEFLEPVWDVALGFARGAMGTKTQGTPFEKFFLPYIEIKGFMSSVAIMDITE